jgi:hypothetical protein
VAKKAEEVKLQLETKEVLQVAKDTVQIEMEWEWAKVRALQVEKVLSSLSMNTMVEAIKVLQTLVVNKRKTNMQLSLESKKAQKERGLGPSGKAMKVMKSQIPDLFKGKDTNAKRVRQWALQVEAYFESQAINMDVDQFRLAQFLLRGHALEWWMAQKNA